MSLEQNICVCHLLLKSSSVEKRMQITWFFNYFGVKLYYSWDCGTAKSLLQEYCCLLSHQLKGLFSSKWHEKKLKPKIIFVLLSSQRPL